MLSAANGLRQANKQQAGSRQNRAAPLSWIANLKASTDASFAGQLAKPLFGLHVIVAWHSILDRAKKKVR
jgi:hypothetical protein